MDECEASDLYTSTYTYIHIIMAAKVDAKVVKACIKEGGKKGQDLCGMADLGSINFFNVVIDAAEGRDDYLDECMKGANMEVDAEAEDRKGGAHGLGKLFYSAGTDRLAFLCHVPAALSKEKDVTKEDWLNAVLASVDGKVTETISDELIRGEALKEGEKFPLKMRDTAINAGFAFLREKGLVLDDESSDDCDYAEAAGIEW
ncbi:hypothetical protein SARC_03385 [Sphaeroforma arctica JP610]|uniref:Uncharacterized protein n=1 Tax=Sphaeroforma arctica JP610 TaxID=667725 RepID=A0A0L0G5T4_9EUKA|nr:hypothetical protein SARC_03385 [Sphaeroforma arctica JP610]KNC84392.1 hypothetical protein SARC_03385 [Sphaeroforma arctica JP610]|eukprot:XP_014158294.1 hypothetical protein SARC_03385 [Sphaeroforma arctica JP610]